MEYRVPVTRAEPLRCSALVSDDKAFGSSHHLMAARSIRSRIRELQIPQICPQVSTNYIRVVRSLSVLVQLLDDRERRKR
ncbi:MAG: hypothetical protein OEQ47_13180, partial [Acidimicrobiia bacterium]|nr:hypothetical protein [Acidimicrobiia bacterium]